MAFKMTLGEESIYPPLPTLQELIDKEIKKLDTITSIKIRSGFDHVVGGKKYHFSYDTEDQMNFSQMNSKAILCLSGAVDIPGITDGKIEWRGHADGISYTLLLDPMEFIKLSSAGGDHSKGTLKEGWVIKSELYQCKSEAELKAKVEELGLDLMYRDAMDLKDKLAK